MFQAKQYAADGYVREVYVFKNNEDPLCPVILHFPLVNHEFRTFKAPGKSNVRTILSIILAH